MHTFGIYNHELELNVKFKQLDASYCSEFLARYEDLPKVEYMLTVLKTVITNINNEVKPALANLSIDQSKETLRALYNGCIMLNPVLDADNWGSMVTSYNPFAIDLAGPYTSTYYQPDDLGTLFIPGILDGDDFIMSPQIEVSEKEKAKPEKPFAIHKAKMNTMQRYLKERVIGQDEAIDEVFKAVKRYQVGLNDTERPIGVFIFAGASGVGKSFLAKQIHEYLFSSEVEMIRIDCGEYQHKHENQKLMGAPSGYTGYEEGGLLAKAMAKTQGATVVLIDEIEKAHPDFWDTMLKVFDEGYLTDAKGNNLNFRNCIFILTSNLGNKKLSELEYSRQTGFTARDSAQGHNSQAIPRREMVLKETAKAIEEYFKIEFMGRIDKVVVFNHLTKEQFRSVADLEFQKIATKLRKKSLNLQWTSSASDLLVDLSSRSLRGVRSMSEIRRSGVEDPLSLLLDTKHNKGTTFKVDAVDGQFVVS